MKKRLIIHIVFFFFLFLISILFVNQIIKADLFYDKSNNYKCSELQEGQIPLVFVSDGYNNSEEFFRDVKFHLDLNEQNSYENKGIFVIEPFRRYKSEFEITAFYTNRNFNCLKIHNSNCRRWKIKPIIDSYCKNRNHYKAYIIMLVHESQYSQKMPEGGYYFLTTKAEFPSVTIHEFGHTFSNIKFGDEYMVRQDGSLIERCMHDLPTWVYAINIDPAGCPTWCSGDLDQDDPDYPYYINFMACFEQAPSQEEKIACWNYWNGKILEEQSKRLDMIELGQECRDNTGCWFTACGVYGWTQTWNGIMDMQAEKRYGAEPIERWLEQLIAEKLVPDF